MELWDLKTSNKVVVDDKDVTFLVGRGTHAFTENTPVSVISPDQKIGTIPSEQSMYAFQNGYRFADQSIVKSHLENKEFNETWGAGNPVKALTGGALHGLSVGLSTIGLGYAGLREEISTLKEENQGYWNFGDFLGTVAPLYGLIFRSLNLAGKGVSNIFRKGVERETIEKAITESTVDEILKQSLTGGTKGILKKEAAEIALKLPRPLESAISGLKYTPAGLLNTLSMKAGDKIYTSLGNSINSNLAKSMISSGMSGMIDATVYGSTNYLSEVALGNAEYTNAGLINSAGLSGIMGGAIGVLGEGIVYPIGKGIGKLNEVWKKGFKSKSSRKFLEAMGATRADFNKWETHPIKKMRKSKDTVDWMHWRYARHGRKILEEGSDNYITELNVPYLQRMIDVSKEFNDPKLIVKYSNLLAEAEARREIIKKSDFKKTLDNIFVDIETFSGDVKNTLNSVGKRGEDVINNIEELISRNAPDKMYDTGKRSVVTNETIANEFKEKYLKRFGAEISIPRYDDKGKYIGTSKQWIPTLDKKVFRDHYNYYLELRDRKGSFLIGSEEQILDRVKKFTKYDTLEDFYNDFKYFDDISKHLTTKDLLSLRRSADFNAKFDVNSNKSISFSNTMKSWRWDVDHFMAKRIDEVLGTKNFIYNDYRKFNEVFHELKRINDVLDKNMVKNATYDALTSSLTFSGSLPILGLGAIAGIPGAVAGFAGKEFLRKYRPWAMAEAYRLLEKNNISTFNKMASSATGFVNNAGIGTIATIKALNKTPSKIIEYDINNEKVYQEMQKELEYLDATSERLQEYMEKNQILHDVGPKSYNGLFKTYLESTNYLKNRFPNVNNKTQMNSYLRSREAVFYPIKTLDYFKEGLVYNEHRDALKSLHPKIFLDYADMVIDKVLNKNKILDYYLQLNLNKLFGIRMRAHTKVPNIMRLQMFRQGMYQNQAPSNVPVRSKKILGSADGLSEGSRISSRRDHY